MNGGLFLRFILGCWHSLTTLSISFQVFSSVFLSVDRRWETQASEMAPWSLESSDGKIFGCDCTRVPLPLVAIFSLCRCAADCAASASCSSRCRCCCCCCPCPVVVVVGPSISYPKSVLSDFPPLFTACNPWGLAVSATRHLACAFGATRFGDVFVF